MARLRIFHGRVRVYGHRRFNLENRAAASALVPWTAILLVLVAVGLFRILMTMAFNSIQLGPTLSAVAARGPGHRGRVSPAVRPDGDAYRTRRPVASHPSRG